MQKKFKVTGLGLKIDGVMIMPGSDVILNANPPSHWQRFGEMLGSADEKKPERKLEVASPEPPAAPDPEPEQDDKPKRRGRPRKVDDAGDEG